MDSRTALGRTGKTFGFELYGVVPDIEVLGDGLGGNVIPIGTYTCSAKLAHGVYGSSSPAKHGSTTAGNPLACAAALAVLDYLHHRDIPSRCLAHSQILRTALQDYQPTVAGSWVSIVIPDGIDSATLQADLYARGVYVNAPVERILNISAPIIARPESIQKAATIIHEVLQHDQSNFIAKIA